MMTRSFRDAWVADLRSGKFKQLRGRMASMRDPNCRCCLGVAMNTLGVEPIATEVGPAFRTDSEYGGIFMPAVNYRFGLTMEDMSTLSTLNDDRLYSFDTIADYIEANFEVSDD